MAERTGRPDAAYLAAGLLATAAQVLLLRELMVDVAGDETAVGVGLAAWFLGIAAGASLARRRPAAAAAADATRALALLAVLPTLAILAGRVLREALAPSAGELPGAGLTLLLSLATLLPSGVAVGAAFTALASAGAAGRRPERAVARLYVLESLGSLLGGMAVTAAVLAGLPPLALAAGCGLAGALLGLGAGAGGRGRLLTASTACGLALAASGALDRWSEALRFAGTAGGRLLAATDTPYQHLALGGDEVRHLYSSGAYVASFPDPYAAESQGNLLALLGKSPRRVLLIGGLERGLVPVLLRHGVERLTAVEPDGAALRFLEPRLPPADTAAWRDPRVRLVVGDPRSYINECYSRGLAWDLVILLGPEPATLLRARLATVEFYRTAAACLSAEGVLVTSLPAAATVLAGETEALDGSLVRSLRAAFPVVRATLGTDAFAIAGASAEAVTLDAAVLAARWRARGVQSPSFDAALLPALLPAEQVARQQAAIDAAAARAPLSLDDRPVSFLHALVRRQQIVSGVPARLLGSVLAVPPAALVALAFAPSLVTLLRVARRGSLRRPVAASHAVAVTGAAGLGWSLLVLFAFQTRAGELYGLMGALVGVFMLGLAVGGTLAARAVDGAAAAHPPAGVLVVWLAGAVAFAGSLPLTLAAAGRASVSGLTVAVLAHAALLLAAGLVTGGVFPLAVAVRLAAAESAAGAAGRVETADHLGAAVAGLTGAVVFVPLLGLARSALLLAALLAAAAAACARAGRGTG
ncbi:MAG TPA: hypothetical protein VMX54_08615 [Vicinamibacteria bacterium]|nr:hypothetical protein [Vicinamibacteria bacterium]